MTGTKPESAWRCPYCREDCTQFHHERDETEKKLTWERTEADRLMGERDELRARLGTLERTFADTMDALEARTGEVERLKESLADADRDVEILQPQVERLEKINQQKGKLIGQLGLEIERLRAATSGALKCLTAAPRDGESLVHVDGAAWDAAELLRDALDRSSC